jgi:hypothetical protein
MAVAADVAMAVVWVAAAMVAVDSMEAADAEAVSLGAAGAAGAAGSAGYMDGHLAGAGGSLHLRLR